MFNVALALVPAGDDDGQAVFSTQPIAGPAYLVIAAFVGNRSIMCTLIEEIQLSGTDSCMQEVI